MCNDPANTKIQENYSPQLPIELFVIILKMLDVNSLNTAIRVNRSWYHVSREKLSESRNNQAYSYVNRSLHAQHILIPDEFKQEQMFAFARKLYMLKTQQNGIQIKVVRHSLVESVKELIENTRKDLLPILIAGIASSASLFTEPFNMRLTLQRGILLGLSLVVFIVGYYGFYSNKLHSAVHQQEIKALVNSFRLEKKSISVGNGCVQRPTVLLTIPFIGRYGFFSPTSENTDEKKMINNTGELAITPSKIPEKFSTNALLSHKPRMKFTAS